jgi:hypothetical protein
VNPNPHGWWKKYPFKKTENSPGGLMQNCLKKIKKYLEKCHCKLSLFQGFSIKGNFQCAFDDNSRVAHVFIKPLFRTCRECTLYPLPPQGCAMG